MKKKYDTPKTPYQRVLESPFVSEQVKEDLKRLYEILNPAKLKRELVRIQNRVFQMVSWKEKGKCIRFGEDFCTMQCI